MYVKKEWKLGPSGYRCDACTTGVGATRVCKRRAIVASERTQLTPTHGNVPFTLHFCKRHINRAYRSDYACVRIESVAEVR